MDLLAKRWWISSNALSETWYRLQSRSLVPSKGLRKVDGRRLPRISAGLDMNGTTFSGEKFFRQLLSETTKSKQDEDGKISSQSVTGTQPVVESPGERFLQEALSVHNSESPIKHVQRDTKKRPKRKEMANFIRSRTDSCCYGCGALLQTSTPEAPGYIPPNTFEVKKKHHQLRTLLCGRCRLLTQGQMIPAVGGVGGYGHGVGFILAEQLRAQLTHLRHEKALIVKLVDIVDFNGSFLTRVRDIVGANPIILVATKIDLLPEGTDLAAVCDWLAEATLRKKLNVISIHLTSSKSNVGVSKAAADIVRQRQGRDVYILGSANVGKSAFITTLLGDMGQRDLNAAAALRYRPVQSAMPGTTLGPIRIEPFSGGGNLYDTPGVHLHHRMAAVVNPADLSYLAPKHRIRGYVVGRRLFPKVEKSTSLFEDELLRSFRSAENLGVKLEQIEEDGDEAEDSLEGYSIFWGGVARLDVVKATPSLNLTFYGPNGLKILKALTAEADEFYKKNVGKALFPPTVGSISRWCGLHCQQTVTLSFKRGKSVPAGDISISGLGWVSVGRSKESNVEDSEELHGGEEVEAIEIMVHTPKPVEVFVRPAMPIGAQTWYDYADLKDKELEARPHLYY